MHFDLHLYYIFIFIVVELCPLPVTCIYYFLDNYSSCCCCSPKVAFKTHFK
jgi:hypothetical protein